MKLILKTLAVAAALTIAQIAAAADISGTWAMTVETQAGTGNPTFVLTQKGDAVSGNYKGQLGEAPVSGTVKGNDVVLSYKVEAQGQSLEVKYTGTVTGNTMAGKVSLGELGEGTFKGEKK